MSDGVALADQIRWTEANLATLMARLRERGASRTYYDPLCDAVAAERQNLYELRQKVKTNEPLD